MSCISRRDEAMLLDLSLGRSVKQIAHKHNLSVKGTNTALLKAQRMLGARSREHAVAIVVRGEEG